MIGIVGSNGFIGRTLVDRLVGQDLPVRAYLREVPVTLQKGVDYTRYSLNDAFDPGNFAGIRTLVLTASASRPNSPGNTPLREFAQNVTPQLQLLEQLKTTSVEHVIYLSSGGAIYGDRASADPISESDARVPSDAYGFGKLCIEAALPMIWQGAGRRYNIIRPSNPIGKHQLASVGAHGLVTTVLHHLRSDLPITVQGDGSAVRDYFAARDLADLVLLMIGSDVKNSVVNASSGTGLSILEVIESCAKFLNVPADVRLHPEVRPAVQFNVLSNQRAFDLFGWSPRLNLTEILGELNTALDLRDQKAGPSK
jgi:UDP-glucose 4-epimerase